MIDGLIGLVLIRWFDLLVDLVVWLFDLSWFIDVSVFYSLDWLIDWYLILFDSIWLVDVLIGGWIEFGWLIDLIDWLIDWFPN